MAADTDADMTPTDIDINLENYRKLVGNYMNLHLYSSALFWADKAVALSNSQPKDVYLFAHCLFLLKQYHRAVLVIQNKGLDKTHVLCLYMAIKCLFEAGSVTEAIAIVENIDLERCPTSIKFQEITDSMTFEQAPKHQVQSALLYLRGRLYESIDNRLLAAACYEEALKHDVTNYEAFDALVQHQMMTAKEEEELLNSLPISDQLSPTDAQLLKLLYESKLNKYHTPSKIGQVVNDPSNTMYATALSATMPSPEAKMDTIQSHLVDTAPFKSIDVTEQTFKPAQKPDLKMENPKTECQIRQRLSNSLDMEVYLAEKYYYNCYYTECFKITEKVLKVDPYHSGCLPVHIACLVDMKKSNDLFSLAHRLVDIYPNLAISWFSVGCYYYVIGKSDSATQYLEKAISLDRLFGPAWLTYGHAFAAENEHDQAMAAYFKASQLLRGCHLPLLYIGLECGLTNNEPLAEKFFQQACKIAPEDPFVLHEMGVIAFQEASYETAKKYFLKALAIIFTTCTPNSIPDTWEPLLNNIGHTYRKLTDYEKALEFHTKALSLAPQKSSTYSAIGFTQALMGQTEKAIYSFHKALGIRKNDSFSDRMLRLVIEESLDVLPPFYAPEPCDDVKDETIETIEDEMASKSEDAEDVSLNASVSKSISTPRTSGRRSVGVVTRSAAKADASLSDMSMSMD